MYLFCIFEKPRQLRWNLMFKKSVLLYFCLVIYVWRIAGLRQREYGLCLFVTLAIVSLFFCTVIVNNLLLEVIPLIFVLGAFDWLLYEFCLGIKKGSVLNWKVFILLGKGGEFALQVFVEFIQVIKLFYKNKVLLVLLLYLLT